MIYISGPGHGGNFMIANTYLEGSYSEIYPNITQYLSVALCKVLESYGLKPEIKWPNDVLISGKKIAGILSETVMSGNVLKGIVVGIGCRRGKECFKIYSYIEIDKICD